MQLVPEILPQLVKDLYLWDQALYTNKILSEESKKKVYTPFLSNYGYGWGIRKT